MNPADFVTTIDNPYMPLTPGTKFRYEGTTEDGTQTVVVEVTRQTKKILGVPAVVVRDTVTEDGQIIEDTFDWFAQDRDGNVWSFGEDSKELEDGKVVSTEGSWEAGKDGAEPGIVMKAHPKAGDKYRQEYYKGVAEDRAEVLSTTDKVTVPHGSYDNVLKTKDDSPLEPDVVQHKYYAKGVGLIREDQVEGGTGQLELVSVDNAPSPKPSPSDGSRSEPVPTDGPGDPSEPVPTGGGDTNVPPPPPPPTGPKTPDGPSGGVPSNGITPGAARP
ncbi:hypothetical protein [Streptomyces exfoliatus]|uniref:hypothetical protein n=1 Tax=Streptomyces exfoliatus TaxID=1905 RepID=UPI003C2E66CC